MSAALLMYFSTCLLPTATPATPNSVPVEQRDEGQGAALEPGAAGADTLVVCAPGLVDALRPWLDHRRTQGHRVRVVTEYESAQSIRDQIRAEARSGKLRWVMLVGDVQHEADMSNVHLPTHLAKAEVNVRWGSEPELATDNWYADLDDDLCPDVALGRLAVDTPDALRTVVTKIIAYEKSAHVGPSRRRVNLIAGVGGFGVLADKVLETATRTFIQSGIPAAYQTSMTYASWRSPYCPDPRSFRNETLARLNEGCLCWVYIGHGQRQGLDWVRVPIGVAPILEANDLQHLNCQSTPPIAVFLACYTAAFDGRDDCLAEQMVQHAQGPVAAIGGSRVTMPYGMAVLSQGLMQQMFETRPPTLGEVFLAAKRRMLAPPDEVPRNVWLDSLARALSPQPADLEAERREHVQLFHLLGDPLLRLPHAGEIDVEVPKSVEPGGNLAVNCRSDLSGECLVELTCRRGDMTFQPERRLEFDGSHQGMLELTDVYRRANDDRYVSRRFHVDRADFETTLAVPKHVKGPCVVRVFVGGDQGCAVGSAVLYVRADEPTEVQAAEMRSADRDATETRATALDRDESGAQRPNR